MVLLLHPFVQMSNDAISQKTNIARLKDFIFNEGGEVCRTTLMERDLYNELVIVKQTYFWNFRWKFCRIRSDSIHEFP